MRALGFQLDAVAELRRFGRGPQPDPVFLASLAESAGVSAVGVRLRDGETQAQLRDLRILRQTLVSPLYVKVPPSPELVKPLFELGPRWVTFISEGAEHSDITSGLDGQGVRDRLARLLPALQDAQIGVSVAIDPDAEQLRAVHRLHVAQVELVTAHLAHAKDAAERQLELERLADAARMAQKLGMDVSVSGGLGSRELALLASIEEISLFFVGAGLVSRALVVGMDRATAELIALLR